MSTQLFLVQVPKEDIFEFCKAIRDEALKDVTPEMKLKNFNDNDFVAFLRKHRDNFTTDAQLFQLPDSEFYYVRILENGWQLRNYCSEFLPSSIVFLDDRSMSSDEIIEANKPNGIPQDFLFKMPEFIDELIRNRRYFIVPIVIPEDYII